MSERDDDCVFLLLCSSDLVTCGVSGPLLWRRWWVSVRVRVGGRVLLEQMSHHCDEECSHAEESTDHEEADGPPEHPQLERVRRDSHDPTAHIDQLSSESLTGPLRTDRDRHGKGRNASREDQPDLDALGHGRSLVRIVRIFVHDSPLERCFSVADATEIRFRSLNLFV